MRIQGQACTAFARGATRRAAALWTVSALGLIAWLAPSAPAQQQQVQRAAREAAAQAQQARPRGAQRLAASPDDASMRGVAIETPAPITNLLQRAEEGVSRGDWKLVVDSLQRVIEDPDGALVARTEVTSAPPRASNHDAPEPTVLGNGELPEGSHADVNRPIPLGEAAAPGALYESARRVAMRVLSSLPPEGRRAYGLIHDGKAKGMLERALAAGDRAGLSEVVSRYLLTRYGDDAADALASIVLDEGRPSEAIYVLRELLEFQSDFDVPPSRVFGKLAAAYAMLDRRDEALAALTALRRAAGSEAGNLDWIEELERTGLASGVADAKPAGADRFAESAVPVGRMPPVHPKLSEHAPWHLELPATTADVWRRILDADDPSDPLVLPVVMPVVSESRLFVRQSTGLVALDADDLGVLWRIAPQTTTSSTAGSAGGRRVNRAILEEDLSPDPLNDYVAGSVTAALGLVFTNEPEGWGTDDPQTQQARALRVTNLGFPLRTRMPTRLVARDARTGRVVWQRGRTFVADDALGEVEFRSPPILVDGQLWAPFVDQRDLYVAVLSPRDGSLARKILVGSFQEPPAGRGVALFIARHDDVVYVPTDRGTLVAIDAATGTPRWAHNYAQSRRPIRAAAGTRRRAAGAPAQGEEPQRALVAEYPWLPSPPVAAGAAVLLAPTDLDELLAFSAADGSLMWSAAAGRSNYIIAATDRHVWIGGRSLACLSMVDGSTVWFAQLSEAPTGRAAMCGDIVQIPTAAGLLSVDAMSGELRERQTLSGALHPLGNLVCAGDSLYSAGPSSVRRYPDLNQGFDAARRAVDQDPDNARAVLRLAWMRILRGEPGIANDLLADGERRGLAEQGAVAMPFARARVQALHALANGVGTAPDVALTYLEQAVAAARDPGDRLRSRMVLAERRAVSGDLDRAFGEYLDVGLSADAEAVESTGDFVVRRARFEIAERLDGVLSRMAPAQRDAAVAGMSRRLDLGVSSRGSPPDVEKSERLRALADLAGATPIGARALLDLARREFALSRWERAEQLLRDCLSSNASSEAGFEALLGLVLGSIEAGSSGADRLAPFLDRLESEFASSTIPEDAWPMLPAIQLKDRTVKSFVDAMRQSFAHEPDGATALGDEGASFEGRYSPTWAIVPKSHRQPKAEAPFSIAGDLQQSLESASGSDVPPRLVQFERASDDVSSRRAYFHAPGDVLFAVDVADGALIWTTTLRPLGYFSQVFDDQRGRSGDVGRRAVLDGAVGVFNGTDGLYGVGMETGRRLWFVPHDVAMPTGREHQGDHRMSARDGAVAFLGGGGRLSLIRTRDGTTLWSRDLRGEPVEYVALTGDRVVTADRHLQRVHIIDRSDGAMVSRVAYRQPDVDNRLIDLVQTEERMVGPDAVGAEEAVRAIDLASGETAWRVVLDKPVSGLFEPEVGVVGVGLLGGDVILLNAATGERRGAYRVTAGESIVDARMLGKTLLVRTFTSRENLRRFALVAIHADSGEELWRRDDLSSPANLSMPLRVVDGGIPVAVDFEQTQGAAIAASSVGLTLLDPGTGRNLGLVAELAGARSATRLNGDFGFWPGFAVVGSSNGIRAFESDWPDAARKDY